MHFKNFDLNLLVALDALLTERNVTRASERLRVTQPAMSNALQRLREQFGDPILERRGRDMEPTNLALALSEPVRELMIRAGQLLEADYIFDPAMTQRTLHIAMSDYCATVFLGPLLQIFSVEAPGLRCEVMPLTTRVPAAMIAGEIDMCITAQGITLLDPNVDTELFVGSRLFSDDFVCAVDRDNPHVGKELDLETYLALPHAVMRFGPAGISLEEVAARRLGLDLRIAAVSSTFTSLTTLIRGTPMIATVQSRLADLLAPAMPMRTFKPPLAIAGLEETLYWHVRLENDKAHIWLRETLARAAAKVVAGPRESV